MDCLLDDIKYLRERKKKINKLQQKITGPKKEKKVSKKISESFIEKMARLRAMKGKK